MVVVAGIGTAVVHEHVVVYVISDGAVRLIWSESHGAGDEQVTIQLVDAGRLE